jgi:hypothetical protein
MARVKEKVPTLKASNMEQRRRNDGVGDRRRHGKQRRRRGEQR